MGRLFKQRGAWALALLLFGGSVSRAQTDATPPPDPYAASSEISGPYIADAAVVSLLDRPDPGGDCARSGPLVFGCLIQDLAVSQTRQPPVGALANPFNLEVARAIRETIEGDLKGFQASGITTGQQLHPSFLTDPGSRLELVGVVNRIDRQFIHDRVPGAEDHNRCGEISLIYRFSYSLRNGDVSSRLPVTMNVVLPAVPRSKPPGARNCADIAALWLAEMKRSRARGPQARVDDLTHPGDGIISLLDGRDIERIELNIQAYRISAGADQRDLGSTAEYVIRVFRWNPDQKMFTPSFLTNQIDRARLLGNAKGDANSCDPGKARPMSRQRFLDYLLSPVVLSDIDTGTLNISQEFLACRATSASPGGATRSNNALFWNAKDPKEQLVTDREIDDALRRAVSPNRQFSFMKTPDDMRLRLNELSCSGCHQARAIAGFHFPGADRAGAPVSNAVFLAGSPHFYGDQSRRVQILEGLAAEGRLSRYALAASYASRPLNKLRNTPTGELTELGKSELVGGWGSACLTAAAQAPSQRQWGCKAGLTCAQLFKSDNAPGMGTCVTADAKRIGDPLQVGAVTSARYGDDKYLRTSPAPDGDWSNRKTRDTRITDLPPNPPADNSYYGAHQEFYVGDDTGGTGTRQQQMATKRDALTGGFPSGMLRLSECRNLPSEATCGLIAASGFNACLDQIKNGKTLKECFEQRTAYAGVRACDATRPCRDDYICLQPMGYNAANGQAAFDRRAKAVSGIYASDDYGQQMPDRAWLARDGGKGDQRGICIPPYFVFQFRSDGHPDPTTTVASADPDGGPSDPWSLGGDLVVLLAMAGLVASRAMSA